MTEKTDVDDRIRARMGKLLELAKRGVGGEKENAGRMLEKLLAKHGMTMGDLLDEGKTRWVKFPYRGTAEHDLLVQVVCSALDLTTFRSRQGKGFILIELTPSQEADVSVHYEAYRKPFAEHMKRQQDIARRAFFTANKIFPKVDEEGAPEPSRLTTEELMDIMLAAKRLKPVAVHKRIESGSKA